MADSGQNAPIGSKKSGYATPDMGPFQCANCIHFDGKNQCNHPDVVKDPQVKGQVQPGGCCTYFRNPQSSNQAFYGK